MAHAPTMTLLLADATSATADATSATADTTSATAVTTTLAERACLAYTNQAAEVSDATSASAVTTIVAAEADTTTTITPKKMPAVTREVTATMDRYKESDEEEKFQNPDDTNPDYTNPDDTNPNNFKFWVNMGDNDPKNAANELGSGFIKTVCEEVAQEIPTCKNSKKKCQWLTGILKHKKISWNGKMRTAIPINWNLPPIMFQWWQKMLNSYCQTDEFPDYPCSGAARKKNYKRGNHSGSRGHQDSGSTQLMDNICLFSPTLAILVHNGNIRPQVAQNIMTESMGYKQGNKGNNRRKSIKSHKTREYKKHYDYGDHY